VHRLLLLSVTYLPGNWISWRSLLCLCCLSQCSCWLTSSRIHWTVTTQAITISLAAFNGGACFGIIFCQCQHLCKSWVWLRGSRRNGMYCSHQLLGWKCLWSSVTKIAMWYVLTRVLHGCGNGDKRAVSREFGDEKIRIPAGIEGTGVNIVGIPR